MHVTVGLITEMTETKSIVTCSLQAARSSLQLQQWSTTRGLRFGHVKKQTTLPHSISIEQDFNQKLTSPDSLSIMLITELLTKSQNHFRNVMVFIQTEDEQVFWVLEMSGFKQLFHIHRGITHTANTTGFPMGCGSTLFPLTRTGTLTPTPLYTETLRNSLENFRNSSQHLLGSGQ